MYKEISKVKSKNPTTLLLISFYKAQEAVMFKKKEKRNIKILLRLNQRKPPF